MIYTDLFHHNGETLGKIVRSHKLQPSDDVTIFCIVTGEKENIISVLEDHLLESISRIEWDKDNLITDFTFISENFNHFTQNLDESDRTSFGVLFAVLMGTELIFSHIGDTATILVEKDGTITSLSNNDLQQYEFQAISSGEILPGCHMYLSSSSLEDRLSDDLIRDLSLLNNIEWKNIMSDVFRKEIQDTIHVGHIFNEENRTHKIESKKSRQLDILRTTSKEILSGLHISKSANRISDFVTNLLSSKQQEGKYLFLGVGLIILFSLLYFFFSALFSAVSSPEQDLKNKLLQAQELIDNSQKLVTNPVAFNNTIADAENILFELRDKKVYISDTQSLLQRIEAMKKEVNDIQTIDISKLPTVMDLSDTGLSAIGVFENNKKLNLIAQEGAILGHARGETFPKSKLYPTGEKVIDFDFSEDGTFYLMTEGSKVLSLRGSEITYVSSNGKKDWTPSPIINTFNGNVYLSGDAGKSISRYKPGINGFSSPTTIIGDLGSEKIVDIGIDGGIYTLLQSGKIIRYIGGTAEGRKNLTINKVPGEYNIGSEDVTQLFVRQNLSYTYVLSGKNIWIFTPDSKRFQDVTAWNYTAQLELQTQEEIKSINIPRDGIIYIVTNLKVYELGFEIADGKIILR